MSLLSNLNFVSTVIVFGCVSFAASNFGVKLGRASVFVNTSGYEYISDSQKSTELYADIANVAQEELGAPYWAIDKDRLRKWCQRNQKNARHWKNTSKYCLAKNTVRHQLIKQGYTLKENDETQQSSETTPATKPKCEDIWNSYADEKLDSINYLYGKIYCVKQPSDLTQSTSGTS